MFPEYLVSKSPRIVRVLLAIVTNTFGFGLLLGGIFNLMVTMTDDYGVPVETPILFDLTMVAAGLALIRLTYRILLPKKKVKPRR